MRDTVQTVKSNVKLYGRINKMITYYGWHMDGKFVSLGEHSDISEAMEKYPEDIVWYLDKEALQDLIKAAEEVI